MIIVSTNFSVYFDRINNIKSAIINSEDVFLSNFCPPTILPIPDQIPDEAPRVIMQSSGGHSNLQFSKISSSLITSYSNVYENDFKKCIENLTSKFNCIFNFLSNENVELSYMGLIITIHMGQEESNVLEIFNKKMNAIRSDTPLYDYSNRLTYVVKEDYFVNVSFSNVRLVKGANINSQQQLLTPGIVLDDCKQDIEVIIDINDRHAHNTNKNYHSNKSNFEIITKLSHQTINDISKFLI